MKDGYDLWGTYYPNVHDYLQQQEAYTMELEGRISQLEDHIKSLKNEL
jgi:hypothetical protein